MIYHDTDKKKPDETGILKGDHVTAERLRGDHQTTERLRRDAHDIPRRTSDKGNDVQPNAANGPENSPYTHIARAGLAIKELQQLETSGSATHNDKTSPAKKSEVLSTIHKEFNESIKYADVLHEADEKGRKNNQPNVYTALNDIHTLESRTASFLELLNLKSEEAKLRARQHAASVTRCAYAQFLADTGNLAEAKKYYDQAGKIDSEARYDPQFKDLYADVATKLKDAHSQFLGNPNQQEDPMDTLKSAERKAAKGDASGAEADLKKTIALAGDPKTIKTALDEIEKQKKENKGNTEVLAQLTLREQGAKSLLDIGAAARGDLAQLLLSQGRGKEATDLVGQVRTGYPDQYAQNKAAFTGIENAANAPPQAKPFDDPYEHIKKYKEAIDHGNINLAHREAWNALRAGKECHQQMMDQVKAIDKQLQTEQDPEKRKLLEEQKTACNLYVHSISYAKLCVGQIELCQQNYNTAHEMFTQVKQDDQEIAAKPEVKIDELLKASETPSAWQTVWKCTKDILKEAACGAAAMLAAVGVVAATSLTGPGALVAGAATGAAVYSGLKFAFDRDNFHWYTPVSGAVYGLGGGAAVGAFKIALAAGETTIPKAFSVALLGKAGVSSEMAAMDGVNGGVTSLRMARELAQAHIQDIGKGMSLWDKTKSVLPLVNAGNQSYRAAYWGLRGIQAANFSTNMAINMAGATTASLAYRGVNDGMAYYQGKYKGLGDFTKSYATDVFKDGLAGGLLGTAFSPIVGQAGNLIGKVPVPGTLATRLSGLPLIPAAETAFTVASPRTFEAAGTYTAMNKLEQAQQELMTPLTDPDQIQRNYAQQPEIPNPLEESDNSSQTQGQPQDSAPADVPNPGPSDDSLTIDSQPNASPGQTPPNDDASGPQSQQVTPSQSAPSIDSDGQQQYGP